MTMTSELFTVESIKEQKALYPYKETKARHSRQHYQQRVAALLDGFSTKTVGLAYRDWDHQQEIQVAMPPANRLPKQERIHKSSDVLLAVHTLMRDKSTRNEWVVAHHVLDLMRQRMWLAGSVPWASFLDFPTAPWHLRLATSSIATKMSSFCCSVGARGLLLVNTATVDSRELNCKELAGQSHISLITCM